MRSLRRWGSAGALLALGACGGDAPAASGGPAAGASDADATSDGTPAEAPAERVDIPTGLRLTEVTQGSGLERFRNENGDAQKLWIVETIGAGVALFDADLDGRLDVYLANGGHLEGDPARGSEPPRDALFLNQGALRFVEAGAELGLRSAGWTMGAYACDVDGDGRSDLYLTAWGANTLYLRGDDGFDDVTAAAGVGDPRWSTGACFLDHDRDGDLDLYVANYVEFDAANRPRERQSLQGVEVHFGPRGMPGARDTFYRNQGDGAFVDATAELGVGSEGYGFQAVAFDYDADGFTDVFVGNDSTPNRLWRNEAGRGFSDRAYETGVALARSGREQATMGVAVGDVDGDASLDLFVTNFSEDYHTLYLGDAAGLFSDRTLSAGLVGPTMPLLGWGAGILDLDRDGDPELFAVNGHVYPQVDRFEFTTRYHQPNQLFRAVGGGRFAEVTAQAVEMASPVASSRGLAWGDLDADGDLDLVVANLDGRPNLLRNDTAKPGAGLVLELRGGGRNPDAVGATVRVTVGDRTRAFAVGSSASFLSTSERRVHVGLGSAAAADVEVRWPSGAVSHVPGVPAGAVVRITEGRAGFERIPR